MRLEIGIVMAVAMFGLAGCQTVAVKPNGDSVASAKPADDACGAAAMQKFVGQKVTVLNDVALPDSARVNFPGAIVTKDFVPSRLNIDIDAKDSISRVYCG